MNQIADATAPVLGFISHKLDRADHLRKDDAALDALRARDDAGVLLFHKLQPGVMRKGPRAEPLLAAPDALPAFGSPPTVFLGLHDGAPRFAAALEEEPPAAIMAALGEGAAFADLRMSASLMDAEDLALIGAGRSLLGWHARHGFCAACGAPSDVSHGGWRRTCPRCEAEHFPRVDPVAIMAIVRGDNILLGRQAGWGEGFFSCLAGYLEPGETIEQGAAREAFEEAGVRLGRMRYLMSQPWPLSGALMIGLIAETEDEKITIDPSEIEAARWFSRDEICAALAGTSPEMRRPFPFAVATHLLRAWAIDGVSV